MAQFVIEYTKTEITRERVVIEADTAEEAVQAVEEYEFDNSESWETDSLRWEVSDVEFVREEEED